MTESHRSDSPASPSVEPGETEGADPQTRLRHTVLVVDDEQSVRESLRLILSEEFRVLTADGGEAALAILGRERVSVMTLDLRMPGLSGPEMLLQIREDNAALQVVIVTAYGSYDETMRALRLSALDLVSKPFEPRAVLDAVGRAARRSVERRPCSPEALEGLANRLAQSIQGLSESQRGRLSEGRRPKPEKIWEPGLLLEPDMILPEQIQTSNVAAQCGEVGLLWAIFNDGVLTYCREISRRTTTSLAYREVERWIFRPDSDAITSFSSLCELFELDVRRMRRALRRFREEPSEKVLSLLTGSAA